MNLYFYVIKKINLCQSYLLDQRILANKLLFNKDPLILILNIFKTINKDS
jgi:hypothetical protein